jgi:NhaP-type Na+/H+ or K+/H+ antiporter
MKERSLEGVMSEMSGIDQVHGIVLMVGFFLLLIIIAHQIHKIYRFPVSPMLVVLGAITRAIGAYIGMLDLVVSYTLSLTSESMLLVFFPILVFESAFSSNWHFIKKEIFQIVPLATTVVISSTILASFALKYILQYDYTLSRLLLLGVILSASDHVAVDSLLEEVYAKPSLETLIGGETMFNEGIVLVLFELFIDQSSGLKIEVAIENFFKLMLGGIAIGIGGCILIKFFLKPIINDFKQETNIVLVFSYLMFWGCEYKEVKFSGAMSVVVLGLYMSAYGRTFISPLVEEDICEFMEFLSKNAQGLIFAIAGVFFCDTIFYEATGILDPYDYIALLFVFIITFAIRLIVLIIHYPIIAFTGYGLTWREFIVLWTSGVKGVLSSGLCIAIYTAGLDKKFTILAIYFGIGNAILSILILGPFSIYLFRKLGFEDISDAEMLTLVGVSKTLNSLADEKIELLHLDKKMNLVNWETVESLVKNIAKSVMKKNKNGKKFLEMHKESDKKKIIDEYSRKFTVSHSNMEVELRRRYLGALKQIYWHRFQKSLCYADSSVILIDSCSVCLDNEFAPMEDWIIVKKNILNKFLLSCHKKLMRTSIIGPLFASSFHRKVMLIYDSSMNFIESHQEAEELICKLKMNVDPIALELILAEAKSQTDMCTEFINTFILDNYPEVISEVQTKRCQKIILFYERKILEELLELMVIDEDEYDRLIKSIDSVLTQVDLTKTPSMPVLNDILTSRFPAISPQDIQTIMEFSVEKEIKPKEVIFSEGEHVEGAFFIIKGRIKETSNWIDQELIVGNIVGIQHLFPQYSDKYTTTATAISNTIIALIPKEITEIQGFKHDLYEEAKEELILLNREKYNLVDLNIDFIFKVLKQSTVVICKKKESIQLPDGAFILEGKAHKKHNKTFLKPSNKVRIIRHDSILLKLPKDFTFCYYKTEPISRAFEKFCVSEFFNGQTEKFEETKTDRKEEDAFDESDDPISRLIHGEDSKNVS